MEIISGIRAASEIVQQETLFRKTNPEFKGCALITALSAIPRVERSSVPTLDCYWQEFLRRDWQEFELKNKRLQMLPDLIERISRGRTHLVVLGFLDQCPEVSKTIEFIARRPLAVLQDNGLLPPRETKASAVLFSQEFQDGTRHCFSLVTSDIYKRALQTTSRRMVCLIRDKLRSGEINPDQAHAAKKEIKKHGLFLVVNSAFRDNQPSGIQPLIPSDITNMLFNSGSPKNTVKYVLVSIAVSDRRK